MKKKIICKRDNCENILSKNNKSGLCHKHRDRNGVNNSFYGKSHSKETIEKITQKTRSASKKLWLNDEYRKKVIEGVSKPRRESFKKEQSKRIKQWYIDNPDQRKIRSKKMKKSWESGKLTPNRFVGTNKSKIEQDFVRELRNISPWEVKDGYVFKFPDSHFYRVDAYIPEKHIIFEFYGNFWHANPLLFKPEDKIMRTTASEIWKRDARREQELSAFYKNIFEDVYFTKVWEKDYRENKQSVLKNIDGWLNWECLY